MAIIGIVRYHKYHKYIINHKPYIIKSLNPVGAGVDKIRFKILLATYEIVCIILTISSIFALKQL